MGKSFSLLILFFPFLVLSQGIKSPSMTLMSMDGKNIRASELVPDDQSVLIYFFDDLTSDVLDNLEYLEILKNSRGGESKGRIFAVFNTANGWNGNLEAFLNGNSIEMETYIDVNGDYQRSLGLPAGTEALLSLSDQGTSERFTGSIGCTWELMNLIAISDINLKAGTTDEPSTLARNLSGY